MKTISALSLLALASSTYGLVLPRTGCSNCQHFTITVGYNGKTGLLGQLSDGQNRVGPGYTTPAKYNFDCNGGKITDDSKRGCILTPPTTQFQCDVGATPTGGFSIGSNGQISYNGSTKFYGCPPDDKGNYNIYTKPVANQAKCITVTLTANGCKAPPPANPSCGYSQVYPNGQSFEFPHLIVPVDSSQIDKKYGTVYSPILNSKVSTIFNFDIRPAFSGKKCSLVFLFPPNPPSDTSSYTFSGAGNLKFSQRVAPATADTTFRNQPGVSKDYGNIKVAPGGSYTVATFPCPAGQRIAYEISTSDTSLTYFQDYNPKAVGLYITAC